MSDTKDILMQTIQHGDDKHTCLNVPAITMMASHIGDLHDRQRRADSVIGIGEAANGDSLLGWKRKMNRNIIVGCTILLTITFTLLVWAHYTTKQEFREQSAERAQVAKQIVELHNAVLSAIKK
jgi:hypothetical protein